MKRGMDFQDLVIESKLQDYGIVTNVVGYAVDERGEDGLVYGRFDVVSNLYGSQLGFGSGYYFVLREIDGYYSEVFETEEEALQVALPYYDWMLGEVADDTILKMKTLVEELEKVTGKRDKIRWALGYNWNDETGHPTREKHL
jgi:hypothetical protein